MNVKPFAILVLLATFGLAIANVKAEVDAVDTYFEDVRGQLLQFYDSEIISHAAIILGLIVGLPALGGIIWNWKWLKRRVFWRHFAQTFVFLFAVLLVLYSFGRLFYWSGVETYLIHASRETTGLVITESNVTSSMSALINYTALEFSKDSSLTSILAQVLSGLNNLYKGPAVLEMLIGASLIYSGIRVCYDHRHDP